MDDQSGLAKAVAFSVAGYPVYLARTLFQMGYEPKEPDEFNRLPNLFSYLTIIKEQRGYLALYTGLRFYLPAAIIKKTSYDLMASVTNHKKEVDNCDTSEVIAICLRESALRVHTTILTYPLVTLGVGFISSSFFGTKDTVEYTVDTLYKGLVPKLIMEVIMVWVSIISRRLTVSLVKDEVSQAIICRVPPFIVQALIYPLNVVSTVMADNGRSRLNPKFNDWRDCYQFLKENNQLSRGSSFFRRRYYPLMNNTSSFNRFNSIPLSFLQASE